MKGVCWACCATASNRNRDWTVLLPDAGVRAGISVLPDCCAGQRGLRGGIPLYVDTAIRAAQLPA